jgi:hypothetical protein
VFFGELSFGRGGDVRLGDVGFALFLTARAVTGAVIGAVNSARRASIVIFAPAFPLCPITKLVIAFHALVIGTLFGLPGQRNGVDLLFLAILRRHYNVDGFGT